MATYAVSVERVRRGIRPSIGVVEIDRSGSMYRRFMDDPGLPGLTTATDADAMCRHLSRAFGRESRQAGACDVIPLRYKPGTSCVIRYELGPPEASRSVTGKVFASDVQRHAATLAALAEASAGSADLPRVVAPIGVWPELGLIVQGAIDGADLTTAALDRSSTVSARSELMRQVGRALAALHTIVRAAGPSARWGRDLEELVTYRSLFHQLTPALARPVDDLIRRLRAQARQLPDPAPVPSHGALRTDQVLVGPHGGLVLLDLDGFCWANPARDLANLLAYMEWRAIRRPSDAAIVAAASGAVLDGYAGLAQAPHPGWLRAYRAATLVKIAGRRLRRLAVDEWPAVPELIACAGRVVA